MAKRIVMLIAVLGLAAGNSSTAAPGGGDRVLTVKVVGFRNAKGRLEALLFNGPKGFPDDEPKALGAEEGLIDPRTLTSEVVFRNLPEGTYAVTVLHDENMNLKMDSNFLGIPREGYGASMNPPKRFRAPKFEETKFLLAAVEHGALEIRLMYY